MPSGTLSIDGKELAVGWLFCWFVWLSLKQPAKIEAEFGRLDVLIHFAGTAKRILRTVLEIDLSGGVHEDRVVLRGELGAVSAVGMDRE